MPGPTDPQELFSDLQRQVANLVRVGTIAEVDHAHTPALVRVQLTDSVLTDWRPYIERRAGDTGTWNPPTVGECVLLLSPGGLTEGGFVLPGLPTASRPTPSSDPNKTVTRYPDGAVFEYDHVSHALKVTLPAAGTADITVPDAINVQCRTAEVIAADGVMVQTQQATVQAQQITLDAPKTHVTGELVVYRLALLNGGMAVNSTGPGGSGAKASINVDVEIGTGRSLTTDGGDIKAGNISLLGHQHDEVQAGGDVSGGPVA